MYGKIKQLSARHNASFQMWHYRITLQKDRNWFRILLQLPIFVSVPRKDLLNTSAAILLNYLSLERVDKSFKKCWYIKTLCNVNGKICRSMWKNVYVIQMSKLKGIMGDLNCRWNIILYVLQISSWIWNIISIQFIYWHIYWGSNWH